MRWFSLLLCLLSFPLLALDERTALKESQAAIGRQAGDYRFTDSEGRPVRLSELRGKPLVVSFVYTGCFQVCPATTQFLAAAVAEAERTLGAGAFRVATIGFNLPFDTPTAMKDFRRRYGLASPHWLFLSPQTGELAALVADFGFRYEATPAGFDHLLQASILDADGRIYRQLYGEAFDVPQFVGPLLELAQNRPVAQGSVAALWEQVKLLCTVYDASSGRYRLDYAVFVELIVGATVLLGGAWVVAAGWRNR